MYVWARLVAHGLAAQRRPRLPAPFGASVLTFRAWPADCDTNGHVNNGRYGMIADIGRYDLLVRTGIWRALRKAGLAPMMGGGAIAFRREIRLWRRFRLATRLLTWQSTRLVFEQRFELPGSSGEAETAVLFITASGFYDSLARRFEPIDAVFAKLGIEATAPEPGDSVTAFLAEQEALRRKLAG
jgi:acyl-CoA thioesterase FadM